MRARYPGTCPACHGAIRPGHHLKKNINRQWIHAPHCETPRVTEPEPPLPDPLPPRRRQYQPYWQRERSARTTPASG